MGRILRSLIYSAAVLLPLVLPGQGAPDQQQPFTLALQAPKQPLKQGEALILRVIVANTSDRAVDVPICQGSYLVEKIYQLHVLDERGLSPKRAPLPKPKGGKGFTVIAGGIHGTELQPGKSLVDEVNLSHVYDLRPGKYKIWIAEPFYRGPDRPKGLVKSNVITVTVVR
jgi:hypothetical protein